MTSAHNIFLTGKKGGNDNKGKKNKDKGKKEQGKKGGKKAKKKDDKKDPAKLIKAALKEGGKKGTDVDGMAAFGTKFFHVMIESANGDWALLEKVMEGMNKKIDPEAEERRGGAGPYGKVILSAGEDKLIMYCNVPEDLQKEIKMKEWFGACVDSIGAKIISEEKEYMKAEIAKDPDTNKYPLKMRDMAIGVGYDYLKKNGLVPDEDDSGDDIDYEAMCEEGGIEW